MINNDFILKNINGENAVCEYGTNIYWSPQHPKGFYYDAISNQYIVLTFSFEEWRQRAEKAYYELLINQWCHVYA